MAAPPPKQLQMSNEELVMSNGFCLRATGFQFESGGFTNGEYEPSEYFTEACLPFLIIN
jgi:hypothetical protein